MSTKNKLASSQHKQIVELKRDEINEEDTQDHGLLDRINTMEVAPGNSKPTTLLNSTTNQSSKTKNLDILGSLKNTYNKTTKGCPQVSLSQKESDHLKMIKLKNKKIGLNKSASKNIREKSPLFNKMQRLQLNNNVQSNYRIPTKI